MFTAVLFAVTKIRKQHVSINGWTGKDVVCKYSRILFSLKKQGTLAIWDNMHRPRGHYAKWDKSCGILKKKEKKRKKTNQHREQVGGCQREEVGGWVGEMGKGDAKVQTSSYK